MEVLISVAVGAGVIFAMRSFEKWKRFMALSWFKWREPAPESWQLAEDELARAMFPLRATVESYGDLNGIKGMVTTVRGLDPSITLLSNGRTTGDVETGHLGFDRQLNIKGNADLVRALLDDQTRDALLDLLRGPLRAGELKVAGGEMRTVVPPGGDVSAALADAAPLLARVAHRLAERIDVPTELAQRARSDSVSGVRLMCLRTLIREYSSQASIVQPLLRGAVGDADAEVRLQAATALGDEGVPALQALVADASVEDDLSARAAHVLGTRMPADVARATLRQELAASSALHRSATARACVFALGMRGGPQDEDLLLQALPPGRDDALRLAAARALGAVGSARAVPSLAELSSFDNADLRHAGRQAIATIQSRLHGATPGQLSLGTADSGQVSLADDVAGRLSDPDPTDR